jgi:choline dehydrogenase-like flavoprotein
MDCFEAIIIGSGPAGTAAALQLEGRNVAVLDVGFREHEAHPFHGNLYDLRRTQPDLFENLIGRNFESLHNIHERPISLKLKAPFMRYVMRESEFLSPLTSATFEGVISLAQGGLANAWGAGVYRFNARDLAVFAITAADLDPFYDALTEHIGVSGSNDDLAPYFGSEPRLQEPLRLSPFAAGLLQRYERRKTYVQSRGVTIGYPRLAVLTRPHHGRPAFAYENLEFFRPYDRAVYNPVYTLDDLVARSRIRYLSGRLVLHYREFPDRVEVVARNLSSQTIETFSARNVVLAAGALNTARLVLQSNGDYDTRLPVLDNPMACIPLFQWSRIGAALDPYDSSFAQLNVMFDDPDSGDLFQGTLFGATGPLRSDVIFQAPLTISANLLWAKYLAPAMGLLMMFYPGKPASCGTARLRPDNVLEIEYPPREPGHVERRLTSVFRKLGYFTSAGLWQYPGMGGGLHYAGMLPMSTRPDRYQTDPDGRLEGTKRVFVADGAVFPALPAKNLTFTIMANAMRVASGIRGRLE